MASFAKQTGAQVIGVVGRDGGYTAQVADACVVVPTVNPDTITPHTEAFQAVVWHLLVSHPSSQGGADEMGIDRGVRCAVFLDRDGVIKRAVVREGRPYPPASVGDVEVLPGVAAALQRLKAVGYLLIVVTNQPDVARGTQSRAGVEAIHARLASELPIDEFRVCYHDDGIACACRKPEPGLILDAARAHGVDLRRSIMVGDRWRDVEAGRRAGCATVFLDHGYAEQQPERPDGVVGSLAEAADWILSRRGDRNETC